MHQIEGYFDKIIGLKDNYAASKIDIAKAYRDEIGFQSQEVVLIGDTSHDYEVACALQCESILVANGHQSLSRLKEFNVPVVSRLADLISEYP